MILSARILFLCSLAGSATALGQFASVPLGDPAKPDIAVTLWANTDTLSRIEWTEFGPDYLNVTPPAPYQELLATPWAANQIRSCSFADLDGDDQTDWVLLVHHGPGQLSTIEHWEGDEQSMVFRQVLFYGPAPPAKIIALTFGTLDGDNLPDILTIEDLTGIGPQVVRHYEKASGGWQHVADHTVGAPTDRFVALTVGVLDDDSLADVLLIRDDETAGALDVRNLYWTDSGTNKIQRANLGGSNVQDLVTKGLGYPRGIAVDTLGGKMYWSDTDTTKIQRADLDGSNVEDLATAAAGIVFVRGVALDMANAKLYWTDSGAGEIKRANLDGTGAANVLTGLTNPVGIALDVPGEKVYWTDIDDQTIRRANLNGTNIEPLVSGLNLPIGLALDVSAGKMYWTDYSNNKIQRANLDGSNAGDVITAVNPLGVAVDASAGHVYWVEHLAGRIRRANLDGTGAVNIVTGLNRPVGIALGSSPFGTTAIDHYEFSAGELRFVATLVTEPLDRHRFQALDLEPVAFGEHQDVLVLDWFFLETVHEIQRWEYDGAQLQLFQILRESIPPAERLIDISLALPICGDNVVNQPGEQCDGTDDTACPGQCREDCTCPPPPDDRHHTVPGSDNTQTGFGNDVIPAIPADFFGPGSDPFDGIIDFKGTPIGGEHGSASTVIQRSGDPIQPEDPVGTEGTVAVELVALSLASVQPITVTYNGGQDPEQWDVSVGLSDQTPDPTGTLTATKTHCNGGTYGMTLAVNPKLNFTSVGNPTDERVLDAAVEGEPPIVLTAANVPWVHVLWDPDVQIVAPSDGIFVPGVEETPPCSEPGAGGRAVAPPGSFQRARDGITKVRRPEGRAAPLALKVSEMPAGSREVMQGGDTCVTATGLGGALPVTVFGTTLGYNDDYDEACTWTSTSPDVVYEYTPGADMTVDIKLCESGYDTKLYVYEGTCPGTLVGCSDDDCSNTAGDPYRSQLLDVSLSAGSTYYIIIDGYAGQAGDYQLEIAEQIEPRQQVKQITLGNPPALTWHTVVPPPLPPPDDPHATGGGGVTYVDLGGDCADPIPADFFGPGSDPFDGVIDLQGDPTDPESDNTSTQLQRAERIVFPEGPLPVDSPPIEVEIVALELKSIDPITVTFNGGQYSELWDVSVGLSPTHAPVGTLTATRTHENGGTFTSEFHVLPKFTFTQGSPVNVRPFDYADAGLPPLDITIENAPFVINLGPELASELIAPNDGDFVPGVEEVVPGNPSSQVIVPVTGNSPCGDVSHSVEPPRPGGDMALNPPELPVNPVHQARKHRYLSIDATKNLTADTSIKVEIAEMNRCQNDLRRSCIDHADCPTVCAAAMDIHSCGDGTPCPDGVCIESGPCGPHPDVGRSWYVQEPQTRGADCPNGMCDEEDWYARVDAAEYASDWTECNATPGWTGGCSTLHIGDCEIVPGVKYNVYACLPGGGVCSDPALVVETTRRPVGLVHYGDVAGGVTPQLVFEPPDGFVNVKDISAFLLTVKNWGTANLPLAHPTWVDLHGPGVGIPPQYVINVADLSMILRAWVNAWPYENSIGGLTPGNCP